MPDTYYQLPADGIGKKMRARSRTVGVDTVHEQAMWITGEPSWNIWAAGQTPAASKLFLTLFNASGSNQVIKLRKLFIINVTTAAVTGALLEFQLKRITALSGGTTATITINDSTDGALSNFSAVTTPTSVTEGNILWSQVTTSEEQTVTDAASKALQLALVNLVPESEEAKEYEMNPGEGLTLKQITAVTAGSFGILAQVTRAL